MANTEIPQRFILKRKRRRSFFFVNIFTTIFLAQWCNWWNRVQLNPWMKMKNATVFKRLKQLEKLTHKSGENGRCILLPWILKRWHCAPSWIRKRGRGKTLFEWNKKRERKKEKKKVKRIQTRRGRPFLRSRTFDWLSRAGRCAKQCQPPTKKRLDAWISLANLVAICTARHCDTMIWQAIHYRKVCR